MPVRRKQSRGSHTHTRKQHSYRCWTQSVTADTAFLLPTNTELGAAPPIASRCFLHLHTVTPENFCCCAMVVMLAPAATRSKARSLLSFFVEMVCARPTIVK